MPNPKTKKLNEEIIKSIKTRHAKKSEVEKENKKRQVLNSELSQEYENQRSSKNNN